MISRDAKLERGNVSIRNVSLRFNVGGSSILALSHVSLEVLPGEFVCVVGPSGCGKSTLLGAVAGFMKPVEGEVLVDGEPVRGPGADRGMVFQQHALFPWKSVLANVEFGLRMAGVSGKRRKMVSMRLVEMVGLTGFEHSMPSQLSGGMQQRVGIARALANNPAVLLMDEPFGSLDALTRVKMQELLLNLWQELRTTVIFVTHDVEEAIFLADRIVMLTARPATQKGIIDISLPRPRMKEVVTSHRFNEYKGKCLEMLHAESARPIGAPSPDTLTFGVGGVAWQAPEKQASQHAASG